MLVLSHSDDERTHLSDGNDFAIGTPSCLFEVLWYLGRFTRSSLSDDDSHGIRFNEVEKTLPVPSNG